MRRISRSSATARRGRKADGVRTALRTFCRDLSQGLSRVRWGSARLACQGVASRNLNMENLEARHLLAADPIISEFLARNDGGQFRDGDGRSSDWIEIFNAGDEAVDLQGYRLTDNAASLSKWRFPSVNLESGDRIVVFASGQESDNYVDPSGNLHTNFTLRRSGEYLALVAPDNTILTEFGSAETQENYPEQLTNVSFGDAQALSLFTTESDAWYFVPGGAFDEGWNQPGFDAAANGYTLGSAAMGYEGKPESRDSFVEHFQTELPAELHAVLARVEFELTDASAISNLLMNLKYDNGFIAYLNGVEVAQDNAPANPSWFSTAPNASLPRDSDAVQFVGFDLSGQASALVDGTNVLAIHGFNNFSDNSDMLLAVELQAGALNLEAATGQTAKTGYMSTTTPDQPNVSNDEVFSGFVEDTKFSVDRGFFTELFQVEITTATEGVEIRYTTNGSKLTATTGTVYAGPITISTTTTLRAAAFKDDYLPTNTDTQTYIFPNDVMKQDDSYVTQPFADWGHAGPDWEMDPEVLNHPDPESRPTVDDLLSLPHLSLVVNWDEMFGDGGIYIRGEGVEIATSVELINPDGSDGFQIDGSVQIVGGSSPNRWKEDRLSMRLKFNQEFGSGDLEFNLFGEDHAQSFDTLTVDSHLNNVWHYGGGSSPRDQQNFAQYLRDVMASDLQNAMGGYAPQARFMFVSINGLLFGMYRLHERPDDNFAASYLGGDNEDYDVLKHNANTVMQGTRDNYHALLDAVREDQSEPANYQAVVDMLDIDNFINYMLMNYYGGNNDWDNHNFYMSFNKVDPEGRWRFHSWDAEKMFNFALSVDKTTTNNRGNPTEIFNQLMGIRDQPGSEEFRLRFADLVQRHYFNEGVLTPESVTAMYQVRLDEINGAMKVESARWGDNQREVPYTRGVEWVRERDRLLNEYFPFRTDVSLEQFTKRGWLPDVDAPVLNQPGGPVPSTLDITLSAAEGTVYFTTDGSDPRLLGGAIAPDAIQYSGALNITGNTTISARVLHDGEWSALVQADFSVASDFPLRITEMNYNPHGANPVAGLNEPDVANDRFEFIELMNVGSEAVDLNGVKLVESTVRSENQGVVFNFASQSLQPGDRLVVVRDREAFQSRYGSAVRIAGGNDGDGGGNGEYGGRLADDGERLTLVDSSDAIIQQFNYRTKSPWPARANGVGSSLELIDPAGSGADPLNWRASSVFGGTPGGSDQGLGGQIVINEVLTNPDAGQAVSVELHNTTSQDLAITNWYISNDSDDLLKAKITADTIVSAGGYHVLTDLGFELDGTRGDQFWLTAADASGRPLSFVDNVEFGNSLSGVSLGPWPTPDDSFLQLVETTLGGPNSGRLVSDVIISEIQYAPVDIDGRGGLSARDWEFVELHNHSSSPVDVSGWRLTATDEFTFAEGTQIGAGESLVVFGFDPTSGTKKIVFQFATGMPPSTQVAGRRMRNFLNDDDGQVKLERPGPAPAGFPDSPSMVFADGVAYGKSAPWPESASGGGDSLARVAANSLGDLAGSWTGRAQSPGVVDFIVRHAGDSNEDGEFNQLDITTVLQGGKYNTGQPATFRDGDWNGDGLFNQLDLVAALQTGSYLQGPLLAKSVGTHGDAADEVFAELWDLEF